MSDKILSVEITYYPFNENVIPTVKKILDKINALSGWQVQTFPTATVVMGEHDLVFDNLKELTRWSIEAHGKCVFVCKFLPDYQAL